MLLTRKELPILIVNVIYIGVFTSIAFRRGNVEFLLYAGVVVAAAVAFVLGQRRFQFGRPILWGMTGWGLLHMAGGNLRVGDGVLYTLPLLRIVPSLNILRYDHVVHMLGLGVMTLVGHHLLRPYLRDGIQRKTTLWLLVVLMGSGFGALNEIIEFMVVLTIPETGVGGYENTLLDLVFNLIGGIAAATWLAVRHQPLTKRGCPIPSPEEDTKC